MLGQTFTWVTKENDYMGLLYDASGSPNTGDFFQKQIFE